MLGDDYDVEQSFYVIMYIYTYMYIYTHIHLKGFICSKTQPRVKFIVFYGFRNPEFPVIQNLSSVRLTPVLVAEIMNLFRFVFGFYSSKPVHQVPVRFAASLRRDVLACFDL